MSCNIRGGSTHLTVDDERVIQSKLPGTGQTGHKVFNQGTVPQDGTTEETRLEEVNAINQVLDRKTKVHLQI